MTHFSFTRYLQASRRPDRKLVAFRGRLRDAEVGDEDRTVVVTGQRGPRRHPDANVLHPRIEDVCPVLGAAHPAVHDLLGRRIRALAASALTLPIPIGCSPLPA